MCGRGLVASFAAMSSAWRRLGLGLGVVMIPAACKTTPVTPPPSAATASSVDEVLSEQVHAVMDEAADPCTDFYRYACGQWLDDNPLPGDQTRFGRFHELREANKVAMREILEATAADPQAEPAQAQLGRFYTSCMDESAVAEAGTGSLEPILASIDKARKPKAMMRVLAQLHRVGAKPLFDVDVDADFDDPSVKIARLGQGGLGMPDRDYYLDTSPDAEALRQAYVEHVALMLETVGEKDAAGMAAKVLAFETQLAQASMPRAELRDPQKRRNKVTRDGLAAVTPKLPWDGYFEAAGRPDLSHVNVAPTSYFEAMSAAALAAKWPVRRAYLKWHLVHALAQHMPPAQAQAHYEFFDKRLRGQAEPTPRWRMCVEATDRALGETLGRQFVEQRFSGDSKKVAGEMIAGIEEAFAQALPQLPWMDEPTRERALEKMHAIVNKVGYPDSWRDYGAMAVGGDHLANVVAGRGFEWEFRAQQIGQPVDDGEWHMTPPTVNAYYNASGNEMVFPAGILQPPFFDAQNPMAMNFGGIGMVMGHELTHGFDDNGRKFDGEGRLTEWWGADAVQRFGEQAACVEQLYSSYEIQPGVHLNGKLTLGENIADLGGIRQAHGAYRAWAEQHDGDAAALVEGLTNEQLLFISFGQIWCTHATPETERVLARTDSHSHARYRVNGPLSNYPAFWELFSCEEGTPMHPPQVCEVW